MDSPLVEMQLNTTEHSSTGYAPCTMIFGTASVEDRKMHIPMPEQLPRDTDEYVETLIKIFEQFAKPQQNQDAWTVENSKNHWQMELFPSRTGNICDQAEF